MAQKSKGMRRKTRRKLKGSGEKQGSIAKHLKDFSEGDRVRLHVDPSIHDGMPHPRFHGRAATVTEQRGRSFVVELKDGGKTKEFSVHPAHLQPL